MKPGPASETLMRRLAGCPGEFLEPPVVQDAGTVHTDAVIADAIRAIGASPSVEQTRAFRDGAPGDANWLRLVQVVAWLVADEWFCEQQPPVDKFLRWLGTDATELAKLVDATLFVTDPDRREELARLVLLTFDRYPAGESLDQASDRLETMSTVSRASLIGELREKRARAEKLRREMERKRAREAAARYSRE